MNITDYHALVRHKSSIAGDTGNSGPDSSASRHYPMRVSVNSAPPWAAWMAQTSKTPKGKEMRSPWSAISASAVTAFSMVRSYCCDYHVHHLPAICRISFLQTQLTSIHTLLVTNLGYLLCDCQARRSVAAPHPLIIRHRRLCTHRHHRHNSSLRCVYVVVQSITMMMMIMIAWKNPSAAHLAIANENP